MKFKRILTPLLIILLLLSIVVMGAPTYVNVGPTTSFDGDVGVPSGKGYYINEVAVKLSDLAATTSAELAGVISDETGTGALVFGTSPTLVSTATSVLTGSIDATASTTVTGVNTLFLTELVVGDQIIVSGEKRIVTVITNNTSLTVNAAFTDTANDTSPDRVTNIHIVSPTVDYENVWTNLILEGNSDWHGSGLVMENPNRINSAFIEFGQYQEFPNQLMFGVKSRAGEFIAQDIILAITDTGLIGMGIANPGAKLQINHEGGISSRGLYIYNKSISANNEMLSINTHSSSAGSVSAMRIWDDDPARELFTIQTDGKVGIGTADPIAPLQVYGSFMVIGKNVTSEETAASLFLYPSSASGSLRSWLISSYYDAGGSLSIRNSTAAGGNPYDAGTTQLVITSNGRVGIGMTTATARLHLPAGTATASTAPLKFTSGTLLTTPEAGAVEFLTDTYYGTITTEAARKSFAFREDKLSAFAATTSAELAGVISDETGTDKLVYSDAPTFTGNIKRSVQAGITAYATGGQANAVAITKDVAEISVCATAADSVKLPTAVAGLVIFITNHGAAAADVFPNADDAINEAAANAAKSLGVDASMMCIAYDDTNWECLTLAR